MMVYENGKVLDMSVDEYLEYKAKSAKPKVSTNTAASDLKSIYNEADKLRLRDIRLESLAWELRP